MNTSDFQKSQKGQSLIQLLVFLSRKLIIPSLFVDPRDYPAYNHSHNTPQKRV